MADEKLGSADNNRLGIILGNGSTQSTINEMNNSKSFEFQFAEFLASTTSRDFEIKAHQKLREKDCPDIFKQRLLEEMKARGFQVEL
jgi:hypothetical protein